MIALAAALVAATPCGTPWPLWDRYVQTFIAGDGRVIDRTSHDRSTSEGQAYALFFSLVADDRAQFERVLRWTAENLAQGDLARNLPAWHWGQRRDRSWGVIDRNSASDADLWIAYALLEAGRLWSEPRYGELGARVLDNVAASEVLGPLLLPGPAGFEVRGGHRINPSYEPPQLLRRFAARGGPWPRLATASMDRLRVFAGGGAVPDWALARFNGTLGDDPVHGREGSYDAIRAYLWIGMMPERTAQLDHAAAGLLASLQATGRLPERIDARTLAARGDAPPGFYAALLPIAPPEARPALEQRLTATQRDGLYGDRPAYYDQNLALFALGFMEARYSFTDEGALAPAWETRCLGRAR